MHTFGFGPNVCIKHDRGDPCHVAETGGDGLALHHRLGV